jgi:DNA invertase Pin-like site-specific DNA recombinase
MDTNGVGYYRTSSQSNVGEDKDTKKRQQNAVMNYASSNGMNVVAEFYDKGVSGTKEIPNRTSFMDMLNYCEDNSIDTIVLESPDRLSRDLVILETGFQYLTSLGYKLISAANPNTFIEDTPNAKLIRQVLGVILQFQKSEIVMKLKVARDRKKPINESRGYTNRKGKGKCEGRKYLTDRNPELFDLVVSYRKKIDRKTHQPFSYRKISTLIKEEHNLSISFNSVKRILEDVVRIKREERNRKRRKQIA